MKKSCDEGHVVTTQGLLLLHFCQSSPCSCSIDCNASQVSYAPSRRLPPCKGLYLQSWTAGYHDLSRATPLSQRRWGLHRPKGLSQLPSVRGKGPAWQRQTNRQECKGKGALAQAHVASLVKRLGPTKSKAGLGSTPTPPSLPPFHNGPVELQPEVAMDDT